MSTEDWNEKDSRALAGLAIRSVIVSNPFHNALTGPQLGSGPRRYLGVVKPIVLFQLLRNWCEHSNHVQIPSWTTFLRALKDSSKFIAFRKSAGQHGLCDQCQHFKKELKRRLSIADRTWCMEEYAAHLLRNWRDRQCRLDRHARQCWLALHRLPCAILFCWCGVMAWIKQNTRCLECPHFPRLSMSW